MSRMETFTRCLVWYIAAWVLAPLPYLAFGQRELVTWCVYGFPALPALIFMLRGGPDPVPFILIGYLLQMGLAAKAVYGREQSTRRGCYLAFLGLLILDVGVAWFGPILFLLIGGGPGE